MQVRNGIFTACLSTMREQDVRFRECLRIYSYASTPSLVSFLQFQFIRKSEHVFRAVFHTLLNRFLSRPLWHDSEQSLSGWDSPPD